MYIIGFENEADYKKYCEQINGSLTYGSTFMTGDIYEAVAKQEAKSVIETRLVNVTELYYDESFDKKKLQESIEEDLIESNLIDQFYQEASDNFDDRVKTILSDMADGN